MKIKNKKFRDSKNLILPHRSLEGLVNTIRPDQLHEKIDWEKDRGNKVFDFWNNPDDAIYDKL